MKDVWPDFADDVDFYAVGIDPTESIERLESYKEQQGYPWPVAQPAGGVLASFNVIRQSTKVAFGGDGIIAYRDSYRGGNPDVWRSVFEELAAGGSGAVESSNAPQTAPSGPN